MEPLCGSSTDCPPDEHAPVRISFCIRADSLGKSEILDMKKESYWLEDWLYLRPSK